MNRLRIARYKSAGHTYYGLVDGERIARLPGSPFEGVTPGPESDRLSEVKLLCPIERPRIFAVGMNYKGHIAEAGAATPAFPQVFMMPSTAAVGSGEAIVLPLEAQIVHHECELAIVIGKAGRRIPLQKAHEHIFGYTCANDVSERVIQKAEMSLGCLFVGKAFDTFCPLGPVIATGLDAANLSIKTTVNGVIRQQGNTSDLLFDVPHIVSYISQGVTLEPGDVILTGTPSGVAELASGDVCQIEISGIGVLENPVVGEAAAASVA